MGAVAGMLFLLGLLCLGGFLLFLGLLCLLFRWWKKRRGEKPGGLSTVLTILFFVLGGAAWAVFLAFFLLIRTANRSSDLGYVDTGLAIEEHGFQNETFTVEGAVYRRLELSRAAGCPKGEPVFTWNADPEGAMGAWYHLWGYYNRGNYSSVPNGPGVNLVRGGHYLFCPEDQLQAATDWYSDPEHLRWHLYDSGEYQLLSPQPTREQSDALLSARDALYDSGEPQELTYPAGEAPEELTLSLISTDGVVLYTSLSVRRYQDQIYLSNITNYDHDNDTRTDLAYPLPQELQNQLSPYFSLTPEKEATP